MIKKVNVIILGAVNRTMLHEFKGLSVEEANIIIPTDGFLRVNHLGSVLDYKVQQIVKEVTTIPVTGELNVYIFVNKVSQSDYYLLK